MHQRRIIEHTDCFHFTQITNKNRNLPSKSCEFQQLPGFHSIREVSWMQIFVFLQPIPVISGTKPSF